MTDDYQQSSEWAQQHRESLTTRHTHEDVLTDREFELLLEACGSLPEPKDLQTRFVCLAAGRLGLRAGEIAHFHAEWLDWDRMLLRIPQHEPCECGYCRRQATQETTHNEDLTHEEAMEARWHPKTVASARSIFCIGHPAIYQSSYRLIRQLLNAKRTISIQKRCPDKIRLFERRQ